MIPKIIVHDGAAFTLYPSMFTIAKVDADAGVPPNGQVAEFAPIDANIDLTLQVNKRKVMRRAANRKSAQLSRARKKAQLEDLKAENTRLQRLVDILDSQPDLVFCVTAKGNFTFLSEQSVRFMKAFLVIADSDDDPKHLSQLLTMGSVNSVLENISELQRYATTSTDSLFTHQSVKFLDSFGLRGVGMLRCAKVNRPISLEDVFPSGNSAADSRNESSNSVDDNPPTKKLKSKDGRVSEEKESSGYGSSIWSKFILLADCASEFTEEANGNGDESKFDNGKSLSSSAHMQTEEEEEEEEFVCTICTPKAFYVPLQANTNLSRFSFNTPNLQDKEYYQHTPLDLDSTDLQEISSTVMFTEVPKTGTSSDVDGEEILAD
jgi:hypothetical protein